MFETIKNFIRKVGVRMGLIQKLDSVLDHDKVDVSNKMYQEMRINQMIYEGYYPGMHDYTYVTSLGVETPGKLESIRAAKVVTQYMASLLFNENCKVNISEEKKDVNSVVQQVLNDNHFFTQMQRYLEYMCVQGNMAIKVGYAEDRNGVYQIKLYYCTGEAFIPLSNDSENVDEAIFVNEFQKGKNYYTLLEFNEWDGPDTYSIRYELYQSSDGKSLGERIPLSGLYPDLEEHTTITGMSR